MMPKLKGETAAPAPWSTRQATIAPTHPPRRPQRAEAEHAEAEHEHLLLAVHVPELAEQRREDRRAQEEAGDDPRRVGMGGAELALEERRGRDDERLHDREGEARGGEQGERDPVVSA
jgi:hypothetical protein